jgi:hypothetical protein
MAGPHSSQYFSTSSVSFVSLPYDHYGIAKRRLRPPANRDRDRRNFSNIEWNPTEPLFIRHSRRLPAVTWAGFLAGPSGVRHFRDDLLKRFQFAYLFHAESLEIR